MSYLRTGVQYRSLQRESPYPMPVVGINNQTFQNAGTGGNGGTANGGTTRTQTIIGNFAVNRISAVFESFYASSGSGDVIASLSTLTYSAVYFEYNGVSYPCYVNGQASFTLPAGGRVITDPLPIYLPAGAVGYWRCDIALPANTTWRNNNLTPFGGTGQRDNYSNTPVYIAANTGTAGFTHQGYTALVPDITIGNPVNDQYPAAIGISGDSIFFGYDLSNNVAFSSPANACYTNGIPFINTACSGDTVQGFLIHPNRWRLDLLSACRAVISNYGTNDLYANNRTFAQVKADLLAYWNLVYQVTGNAVWHATLLPRVTYSGNPYPVSQQSYVNATAEGYRNQINAWLRAPISAGANSSALYDAGGALAGIIDYAAYFETDANNSPPSLSTPLTGGRWYCGPGNNTTLTADGVHPSTAGYIAGVPQISLAQFVSHLSLTTDYT